MDQIISEKFYIEFVSHNDLCFVSMCHVTDFTSQNNANGFALHFDKI